MTRSQKTFRTLSNEALAQVTGGETKSTGGRHAEREAADTAASAVFCDSVTVTVPFVPGTITIHGCGGGATWNPPA